MSKTKPLDQMSSTNACALNHAAKVQNKIEPHSNILKSLMEFASSVLDFRRLVKGNIRYRLSDIILLLVLGRASKCVGRAEIIEFGRHNLGRFRKMGMFRNGIPSEATLCRIENGIDDLALATYSGAYPFTFRQLIRVVKTEQTVTAKTAMLLQF